MNISATQLKKRYPHTSLWLAVPTVLALTAAHAADPSGSEDEERSNPAVGIVNHLGISLYRQLRTIESPADNVIISPVSVATAVSLLRGGADGETAEEFARTLRDDDVDDTCHEKMGRLLASFAQREDEAERADEQALGGPDFTVATGLWVADHIMVHGSFRQMVRTSYRTNVSALDKKMPEATADAINSWADNATAGKIPRIIDVAAVRSADMLLVNAVTMKAGWAVQFAPERTSTQPFFVTSQETVDIPMMQQRERLGYRRVTEAGFGVEILELPYRGPLRMLILLPQGDTTLTAIEDRLTLEAWQAWSTGLHEREVTAWIPRFQVETSSVDLVPPLQELGLSSIADGEKADFSRMTSQRLAVNLFRHSALITVDENGTEAVAVTDSGFRRVSVSDAPPVEFRANRPFLFAVDDHLTGTIMFIGKLTQPK